MIEIFDSVRKYNYFQICYQVTDQQTIEREYASLKTIDDNFPKYVVSCVQANLKECFVFAWQIE
ncbi:MAG: hypothetical protein M0P47_13300 [Bacteroidales bacterium]|nr:hypothetical protein [Bacteroidales bacterium]